MPRVIGKLEGFSIFLNNTNETPNDSYFEVNDYLPEPCQINLDYTAPEFVMDNEITQANDMFALGCLAYAVHNQGQSLLQTFNNRRTYERKIQALSTMEFGKMPYHLQDVLRRLLTRYPSQRITAAEFQNSKYFDNILVSTMRFLESFAEKTREEKAQFMKGLSRVLGQFPERVLKRKILPSLLEELKNHQLLPYTIPNIFIIIQQLTPQEFCDLVLPSLKPVFLVRDPPQNMIVLLEKLDVLQQKTPREVFRDDVMPLVYAALETPTAMVQEKALRIVPLLAESLDYTTVKNSLFPRVQTLFVQTTVLSVKVSTLICFHSMIKVVDKFTMQEKLVPLLKNIKTKEPAVMLATLAVYDEMGKHLDKEIVATEILPQLWRMSFGPLLNLDQFRKFMRTIRELTNRVEEAHTRHLQEVKSLEDQTRSVSATPDSVKGAADIIVGDENTSFEALVQGKPATPQVGHLPSVMDAMNGPSQLTSGSGWSTASSSPAMRPLQPSSGTTQLRPSSPAVLQQPSSPGWTNTMLPTPTQAPKSSNTWSAANTFSDWTTPSSSPFMNQPALSTPSLPPPPSSSFANLTIQSKPSPNYSALHTLTSHHPSTPSTGMALLQPTTRSTATSTSSASQPVGHKLNNLNAFDPLG
ncbi:uncharacterized protein BYT42DRAFT_279359 [Radiomyces spectabilis]|uniref:uncharacterized protein n=1 Tax=Radiomyces spectabilis TaxID=64574 RepID=UPI00221F1201|nr:uncharacterized protein BYT42DRAFT_279359 [Radiomyces spectabilis]KAI8384919.1 hypothetical protein BYT42DRAFT_279359 [Radiomyces spectabilis]